jgi:uncharacterized membrane protein
MSSLPIHPLIVHVPIALLILSVLFELAGRALDADWWRRAAVALLVLGTLGAAAAVITGLQAGEAAERQGVADAPLEKHEDAGKLTLALAIGAVVTRALGVRAGSLRKAVTVLALALQLAAAILVGVAGFRGGRLVYEHGAGVRVHGVRVVSDQAARPRGEQ